jgi:hypothetical protein
MNSAENDIARYRLANPCELGTIKIEVCHVRFAGASITRKFDTLSGGITTISERGIKGSTISHSTK